MSSTEHDRMMQDLESARAMVRDAVDGVWRSPLLADKTKEDLYDLLDAAAEEADVQAERYARAVAASSAAIDRAQRDLRQQRARADAAEGRAQTAEDALRALRADASCALEAIMLAASDGHVDLEALAGYAWPWPTDVAGLAALAEELDPAVPAG